MLFASAAFFLFSLSGFGSFFTTSRAAEHAARFDSIWKLKLELELT